MNILFNFFDFKLIKAMLFIIWISEVPLIFCSSAVMSGYNMSYSL